MNQWVVVSSNVRGAEHSFSNTLRETLESYRKWPGGTGPGTRAPPYFDEPQIVSDDGILPERRDLRAVRR